MSPLRLYDLFAELRKDDRFAGLGMDNYFQLLELLEKAPSYTRTFDDLCFACETLWVKHEWQRPIVQAALERRRQGLEAEIQRMTASFVKKIPDIPIAPSTLPPAGPAVIPAVQTPPPLTEAKAPPKPGAEATTPTVPAPAADTTEATIALQLAGHGTTAPANSVPMPGSVSFLPPSKKFLLDDEYFPISSRILQQSWRGLTSRQEIQDPTRIHLMDTIRKTSREGFFTDFEYAKKKINTLSLFILIDQGAGMVAYEAFGRQLVKTAAESQTHAGIRPYYFTETPLKALNKDKGFTFYNKGRTASYTSFSLFSRLNKKNIVVLVYSDARSIMGDVEKEDVLDMRDFLNYLLHKTAYVAWLNPAPVSRWKKGLANGQTSVLPEIPMYEATRQGLELAIQALKGKNINLKPI